MKTAAIIPAAGRGTRMLQLTDNCPKCMVPVAGRPLIAHLLDQMIENEVKDVYIIVGYKKEVLMQYVDFVYSKKLNITYVEQKEILGLGHAIWEAMKVIDGYDSIFIMLSDSIFTDETVFAFGDKSYITCVPVRDYSRWCIAASNSSGRITEFIDKPAEKPSSNTAVAGAYYFSNAKLFKKCVDEAIASGETIRGEYQLSSAMNRYMKEEPLYTNLIAAEDYYDFGELDTYNKNKRLFNEARVFNSISYRDGLIVKRSNSNYHKIQKEINWYLALPSSLSKYVPKLLEYSLSDDSPYYCIPYCDGTTLQELFLYSNLSKEKWSIIYDRLTEVFNDFESTSREHSVDLGKFLLDTCDKRHVDFDRILSEFDGVSINGDHCVSSSVMKDYIFRKFNELKDDTAIIHGDMTFSNILYDLSSDKITLIDPRGDFNGDIIYGDMKYDVAKIAQCVVGDYDSIVKDMFSLNRVGSNIYMTTFNNECVYERMLSFLPFVASLGFNVFDILFITAIQFLTMRPLHSDAPSHQEAMKVKAIELLNVAYRFECK